MSTATQSEVRAISAEVTDKSIVAHLADGRTISVPLEWSWRLREATPAQRAHWELIGEGQGIRWPEIDEDISVEGMLRGVPARRASRRETQVLLDASSLIDAEQGKPIPFEDLEKVLRENHARLVLTYTSVWEFAGPIDRLTDPVALREKFQRIERMPLGYLREGGIPVAELREAVAAFTDGRECHPIDPFVPRWDWTWVAEGPPPSEIFVNQSLFDFVATARQRTGVNPLIAAEEGLEEPLQVQFANDRKLPTQTRSDGGAHFRITIPRKLAEYKIDFAPGRMNDLADWIFTNPAARCPGYRLAWECRRGLVNNITEKASGNDIWDIAAARAVPYVDAVTMDRNAASRCRTASKLLHSVSPAINYEERIFTSLREMLQAKF